GLPCSGGAGQRGVGRGVAGPWDRRVAARGRVGSRLPGRGAAAARGGGAGHRSGGVVRGDGMTGTGQGEGGGSPKVSPFAVPLLLGGVILGFVAGYVFLWWGLLLVGVVVLAAAAMVFSGRSRDGATAAILGTVAGYGLVLLLAVFRGVL